MPKLRKGGSILTKLELDETRRISKLCCQNPNIINYIINIVNLIVQLVEEFAIYHKKNVDSELLNRLHQFNKMSPGQIKDLKALKEVIQQGNFRERMTLIMNFGLKGCDIIIWAIATQNHLLSKEFIDDSIKRLKILTSLDILDLQVLLKCKRGVGNCSTIENTSCIFSLLNREGPTILSRYSEFPIINTVRMKRPELVKIDSLNILAKSNPESAGEYQITIDELNDENKRNYSMKVKDIYPPLSDRERDFIGDLNPDDYPPYLSGYMLFDTNEKNFYNILASKYKQLVIAGPSGSTDLFLATSKMFNIYDLKLGILACVGWLCNIPQHSVFEILMGSLPYELKDWNATIDAHSYVEKLNAKLNSRLSSVKVSNTKKKSNRKTTNKTY